MLAGCHRRDEVFGTSQLVQVIVILYSLRYLTAELKRERMIHLRTYLHALQDKLPICKYTLMFLVVVYLSGLLCRAISAIYNPNDGRGESDAAMFLYAMYGIDLILFTASNFYLVALLYIMMIELSVTNCIMQNLSTQVDKMTLNNSKYFQTRSEIIEREKKLPINVLVMWAIFNALMGLAVLFPIASSMIKNNDDGSSGDS